MGGFSSSWTRSRAATWTRSRAAGAWSRAAGAWIVAQYLYSGKYRYVSLYKKL